MESMWFNFRTGQYDALYHTPETFEDYIPQSPPAQSLYHLYLEMGKSPLEAVKDVLIASLGDTVKSA